MGTLFLVGLAFVGGVYVGKTHYIELVEFLKIVKDKFKDLFKKN